MGIALWIQPPNNSELYSSFQTVISQLSSLLSANENGDIKPPVFVPHITLTSGIILNDKDSIIKVLDETVEHIKGHSSLLDVVFLDTTGNEDDEVIVCYGTRYFQAIHLQAQKSTGLVTLAKFCRKNFVIQQTTENQTESEKAAVEWSQAQFNPHLSLAYTDQLPIPIDLKTSIETSVRELLKTASSCGWKGGRLSLVKCEGPIMDWPVLGYRDI